MLKTHYYQPLTKISFISVKKTNFYALIKLGNHLEQLSKNLKFTKIKFKVDLVWLKLRRHKFMLDQVMMPSLTLKNGPN